MSKNEQGLPTFENLREYIKTLPVYETYKADNPSPLLFESLILDELIKNRTFTSMFLSVSIKICSTLLDASLKVELESEEN